jgi:PAS domain S-box-containing protein
MNDTSQLNNSPSGDDVDYYFKRLFNESIDGLAIADAITGLVIESNPAMGKLVGKSREQIIGMHQMHFHPTEDHTEEFSTAFRDHLMNPSPSPIAARVLHTSGKIIDVEIQGTTFEHNGRSLVNGVFRNVDKLNKSKAVLKARMELSEFALKHSLNEVLVKTLDEVCSLTKSTIGFYHFMDDDSETINLQAWSTNTNSNFCHVKGAPGHYPLPDAGVWADCAREKKVIIHNDFKNVKNKRGMPEGHAEIVRELIVPIIRGGVLVAILGVGNKALPYENDDIELVTSFADLAWDIAEKNIAHEKLQASIEKLRETNDELEAFSFSVSHDLKSPLRHISSFSQLLMAELDPAPDTDAFEMLLSLQTSAEQMTVLIEDLLKLSQIQRSELSKVSVDLGQLAEAVISRLSSDRCQKKVEIKIEPDMQVDADPNLMKIVLDNILGNACKFTSNNEFPSIEVGVKSDDDIKTYFVKDNGIGFNDNIEIDIFAPFKRMHSKKDYPGTGIGLAIVQRIIRRHGGAVWAESEAGKGTTIFFTLGASSN